jgi:DNA-binding winged helix-turn-helix (wHTH) protein
VNWPCLSHGTPVPLGARAFDVLALLVVKAGDLVTKAELLDKVWPGLVVEENNLQVHISTLLKLLGPERIVTIAGQGYRFTARVSNSPVTTASAIATHALVAPATTASTTASRSIAVLAFINQSTDPEQEYFSDGLSEDIIAKLSRSPWLYVIARNSSFSLRPPHPSAPDICRQLASSALSNPCICAVRSI